MIALNNKGWPLVTCFYCRASNYVEGGYNGGGNCPACGKKLLSDKDLKLKFIKCQQQQK